MPNPARLVTMLTSWMKEQPLEELTSFLMSEQSELLHTGESELLQVDIWKPLLVLAVMESHPCGILFKSNVKLQSRTMLQPVLLMSSCQQ